MRMEVMDDRLAGMNLHSASKNSMDRSLVISYPQILYPCPCSMNEIFLIQAFLPTYLHGFASLWREVPKTIQFDHIDWNLDS